MKTMGLTRRIDELGRIVIPKEIRQNMKLRPGELLEVYISDSDVLSMKKHEILEKTDNVIETLVNTLSKSLNSNVYIIKNNIVLFSNENSVINKEISTNNHLYNVSPHGDTICQLMVDDEVHCKDLIIFSISFLESYYELN